MSFATPPTESRDLGECQVCLDVLTDPVCTLCGHVFCWACLYRHLQQRPDCPTCKAHVTEGNVIPMYGRGRASASGSSSAPPRPAARRPTAPAEPARGIFEGGFFHVGFGFFPALFVAAFANHATGRVRGEALTPEQTRARALEHALLGVGSVILFFLLFI